MALKASWEEPLNTPDLKKKKQESASRQNLVLAV